MSWLSGISIACFAASYAIALALEISRLWFRSALRGALLVGFGWLGLATHTVYVANELVESGHHAPLSSWRHWLILAAWGLAAVYCYLAWRHRRATVGVFLLPLVLAMIGAAYFFSDATPIADDDAQSLWGAVHGLSLLLGTVVVTFGFAAGIMYLVQAWRLKHKLPPSTRAPLWSLERLAIVNARCLLVSMALLAVGVLSGMVLNIIYHLGERRPAALDWTDPVVWTSGLLLAWLAAVSLFGALYRPARRGRKVAYLTIGSLLFLVLALAVTLLSPDGHGRRRKAADTGASALAARSYARLPIRGGGR